MEHPPERVTLSVVIPVYNEAATIATLLARVQAVPFETEIILVDDGSTDGTWDVVQAFADVSNITLVRRARNQGKGAALRDGFARATKGYQADRCDFARYRRERVSRTRLRLSTYSPYRTMLSHSIGLTWRSRESSTPWPSGSALRMTRDISLACQ